MFRRANYGWLCAPIQGRAIGDEPPSAITCFGSDASVPTGNNPIADGIAVTLSSWYQLVLAYVPLLMMLLWLVGIPVFVGWKSNGDLTFDNTQQKIGFALYVLIVFNVALIPIGIWFLGAWLLETKYGRFLALFPIIFPFIIIFIISS